MGAAVRIFRIQPDKTFSEYSHTPFQADHEEEVIERWLESNSHTILEDGGVAIIGRQVPTNLGGRIDLLGLDRVGNVVVIELKRDRTPRDTIAQALEYASSVARLDVDHLQDILCSYQSDGTMELAEFHRESFRLAATDAVAFNKNQHIVVAGQNVTAEIRQTAAFLRGKGIAVTCVEFAYFQAEDGSRLLSQEIVVGRESDRPPGAASSASSKASEETFLASVDDHGRAFYSRLVEFAKRKSMPVEWGVKGFSLNVDVGGKKVVVCTVYPPDAVGKGQTLRTALRDQGGAGDKTAVPESELQALHEQAFATGLFTAAGQQLKCPTDRALTETQMSALLAWCEAVEQAVRKHGLR